ncbi:hypothetical protein GGR51DRAFT_566780 [Nemania sp. FL0031]|nr:hypothetical protein GGR51DRAFT_566780 [Nemania sp. FL0031]
MRDYHCVFCGVDFVCNDIQRISWTQIFRGRKFVLFALECAANNPPVYDWSHGVQLTGIGVVYGSNDGLACRFTAPADPNEGILCDDGSLKTLDDGNSVTIRPFTSDQNGFIFHDRCWCLFEKFWLNRGVPVPLKRLFEVLRSQVFVEYKIINWGYDYGGYACFNNDLDHHFPWEARQEGSVKFDTVSSCYYINPYAEEASRILEELPELPPKVRITQGSNRMEGDPFSKLPYELRLDIAKYLAVPDLLQARHASSFFWVVFHDPQFWAFRFESDRAWFFEVSDWTKPLDWRWLYCRTHFARLGPELKNRVRIWKSIEIMIAAYIDLECVVTDPQPAPKPSLPIYEPSVRRVAGYLNPSEKIFRDGCRQVQTHRIAIPTNLSQFSISYTRSPSAYHISGIKFTTVGGTVVQLGYWTGNEDSVSVTIIWGFTLAVGVGGIQAIQCITGCDTTSRWLGQPNDTPKTRRLAAINGPLDFLEVGFDGYKIVSLATQLSPSQIPKNETLRTSGLWYPDIPNQNLSLNERSPWKWRYSDKHYTPLFWTHFGGPGGKYLRHLTRLDLIESQHGGLQRIEFKYDIDDVPAECQLFGRLKSRGETLNSFSINGPDGEIITAIEVRYRGSDIFSLNISTNRGRLWLSKPESLLCNDLITRTLKPQARTAITGIYAGQIKKRRGLISAAIRVISEDIRPFKEETAVNELLENGSDHDD